MARTADRQQRQRLIVDAASSVAREQGLAAVTVARVAEGARISVGLVQHYFASKELLVVATHRQVLAEVEMRVAEIVDDGERRGHTIRAMLSSALAEMLPLDERRRQECLVVQEFTGMASRGAAFAEVARAADRSQRARLRQVMENAVRCGEAPAGADATLVADEVWALTSGLARAMLLDPDPALMGLLISAIRRALPHECRRHLAAPASRPGPLG